MNQTLAILVSARDEASATLKNVSRNGQAIGTSLNGAAASGTRAISTVDKSAARFTSTLKKVAGYVGIAFAVTEVVKFGKEALHAFEGVEKQQSLIEGGLERIGAAGQLKGLLSDLKGVSDRTVTLQGDTDQVAAAVLNVGHSYFQSLGPQAGQVLAGLTQGILNIAAATHKSLGMLQRSLTNSIVNTPDKAIGILNKLGIATEEQAAKWTNLAKAGKLEQLRQEEINAVTNAYPDAAGQSATAGDRLAKTLDDIKIRLGRVLVPLISGSNKLLGFAANNTTVVLALVATGAALRILPPLLFSVGVGLEKVGAAGIASSIGNTAGAIQGMGIVAKTAAMAGIGLLVAEVTELFSESARTEQAINDMADAINSGAKSAADLRREFEIQARARNLPGWARQQFSDQIDEAVSRAKALKRATREVDAEMDHAKDTATRTGHAIQVFAGMGKKAFHEWAKDARKSAIDSILSLDNIHVASRKTARGFLHDSNQMAKAAQQQAHAMHQLASKSQDWVPDKYKQWLVSLGPQAVANFEQLTKSKQQDAVKDWDSATKATGRYNKAIGGLKTGPIDAARTAAERLQDSLTNLPRQIYIDIYLRQHGTMPGDTSPPPSNPTTPGTYGPVIPSAAPMSAPAVSVGVSIDRRRFVEQTDYQAKYAGY